MKTIAKLLILLLATLSLCGCKTKQKVTENLTEIAHASGSSVQQATEHTEKQEVSSTQEEATHTQWSDSIVEKFHERIVTDSCGRVLLHEVEHSKENFKGQNKCQTNRAGHHQENATSQHQEMKQASNDSVYNGGTIKEVTISKKRSLNWTAMTVSFLLGVEFFLIILLKIRKR